MAAVQVFPSGSFALINNSRVLPYLLILVAGILWGGTFSLALIATSDGSHPLVLTTWQVLVSAMIFTCVCRILKVPVFRFRNLGKYVIIGVLGHVVPDMLYYTAAPHLSAGILSITVSTVPLFTYVIMWVMRFERIIAKRALGLLFGMLAILLLVIPDQGLSSGDVNFWILLVVLCALLYAAENVYVSEGVSYESNIFELLCGSTIVSSIFLIPITFKLGMGNLFPWILTTSGWAITSIAVVSVVAYSMFFHTIKTAGPVFASQCAYIVTIAGVLWGIVIFSEEHTVWVWMSVLVIMLGVALVSPSRRVVY